MERLSGWELSIGRINRILHETPGKQKVARRLFFAVHSRDCHYSKRGFGVESWGNLDTDYYETGSSNWNETDITLFDEGSCEKLGYGEYIFLPMTFSFV
jgi:hypothetical protein